MELIYVSSIDYILPQLLMMGWIALETLQTYSNISCLQGFVQMYQMSI